MEQLSSLQALLLGYQNGVLEALEKKANQKGFKLTHEVVELVIEEEYFYVRRNDEIYVIFQGEKGKDVIMMNNVDNHDFLATLAKDQVDFGLVMLALAHIDDIDYLKHLVLTHETEFVRQLVYVLGFCTLVLDDGTRVNVSDIIDQARKFN